MTKQEQAQTTPEQREELARLAEAADKQEPGPWSVGSLSDEDDPEVDPDDICDYEVLSEYTAQGGRIGVSTVAQGMHKPAAKFIAAANPVAVKALLADLDAAEQRAAVAEKEVELLSEAVGCQASTCKHCFPTDECVELRREWATEQARAALGLAAPAEQ